MSSKKNDTRKRMLFMFAAFITFALVLVIRTAYIQIIEGPSLKQEALEQQTRDSKISPERGIIYDRNGKVLAQSSSSNKICVDPSKIDKEEKEKVARTLSEVLEMDYEKVLKIVSRNSQYELVKRRVDKENADKLLEMNIAGILVENDTKRYYPSGSLAAHIIGFTGDDNQGLEGIEMIYDKELGGTPGRIITAKNTKGEEMPFEYEKYIEPTNGYDMTLTIDETIQHFAEKHLENAVEENLVVNGGACIVMDPKTGEILAMTTKPDYDLNNYLELNNEEIKESLKGLEGDEYIKKLNEALYKMWRNKAVVDTYEPGSTFKSMVAAMALEENVVKPDDVFSCSGSKVVSGVNIRCHKTTGHGTQTFVKGVHNSCNPVFMEVGEKIGVETFTKYFRAFGFGEVTGFELPGEAAGLFFADGAMHALELATSSFGQGFNVTPLQMVTAMSAVCNGGKLMKPYIVKSISDKDGNIISSKEPETVRQVISSETSKTMCSILEGVVSEGGGKNAYVKGYRVAGKTGTSEKQPRGSGEYVSSFLGFAPADDPQIVVLVILDTPTGGDYYGSMVAAPVVGNIMEDILRYLGVERQYTEEEMRDVEILMPDVVGKSVDEAMAELTKVGFKYHIDGEGTTVKSQMPRAGTALRSGALGILYTSDAEKRNVVVPDVKGMSLYDTNLLLMNTGLNFKISGPGKIDSTGTTMASAQEPAPGMEVPEGTIVSVSFKYVSNE